MSDLRVNIIDNFFEKEIHDQIYEKIVNSNWTYNGGSKDNPFWHVDNLEEDKFFSDYLQKIILEKINLSSSKCIRIYANGQTAGMSGDTHIDDGHLTFLYFVNQKWNVIWGGHLAFLNVLGKMYNGDEFGNVDESWHDWNYYPSHDDELEKVITYKPNTAVLFPSNIVHFAMAPHSSFAGMRISLAYKFYLN